MDSDALELSLGVEKQCYIPPSIAHFLNHLSRIRNVSDRLAELNGYVSKLEQEMSELDALKRNPHRCMLLLKDAVEFLKKEGEKMKREIECTEPKYPVTKEFLPSKRSFNEQEEVNGREENLMMNSAYYEKRHKSTVAIPKPCKLSIGGGGGGGGAFTPFKGTMAKEEPVLSLLPPGTQNSRTQVIRNHVLEAVNGRVQAERSSYIGNGDAHHQPFTPLLMQQQHQSLWKNNRICWSPELHAKFIAAMDILGGPEVATPKQIRAIMEVEGLTTDQVKSHLQKYRLHKRGQHAEDTEPVNR